MKARIYDLNGNLVLCDSCAGSTDEDQIRMRDVELNDESRQCDSCDDILIRGQWKRG